LALYRQRWNLIQEEKEILKDLTSGPNEALDVRLGEIYEELATINSEAAESKARRILFGLGFDAEMQIRPTKYFSGIIVLPWCGMPSHLWYCQQVVGA